MSTPAEAKSALRARVRANRRAMSAAQRADAEIGIRDQLTALVTRCKARSLCCYVATAGEPGTAAFLAEAQHRGIQMLLPVSREDGLLGWGDAGQETAPGRFGITEPQGDLRGPEAAGEVDLLLTPAAAASPDGTRLGWGRGYYDRTLASLHEYPPVYAVIYDSEVLDSLPSEDHDFRVTGIVTPTRIIESFPSF